MKDKEIYDAAVGSAVIPVEDDADSDRVQLARLGKKQVLRREFGFFAMLGFSCTVMISWEAALLLFGIGFSNGGYAGSFWGYLFVWLGNVSAFATMAELASMVPTAAGQYHWVAILAPKKTQVFLSYVIGWLTVTGWFAVVASACFLTAQVMQGIAVMTHPDYTILQWQIPLVYWLVLIVCVLFNTVAAKLLPQVEGLMMLFHISGFFAILIPIAVLGVREDASVVFNSWLNSGNWPTQGVSLLVGLVGPAFGLLGGDAAVHMSEEIKRPATIVPRAMIIAVVVNGALGFSMIIVQLFFLGNSDAILTTPIGFPFMALFQQAVGVNAGAVVMAVIVFILVLSATISCLATASRLTWAFARDRGLPGWSIWARVDKRTIIPLLSVVLVAIVAFILSFIGFGSTLAFNDVVSLTVANLYLSYLIGNTLLLYRRVMGHIQPFDPDQRDIVNTTGATRLTWGPFKIPGILGIINNALGCAFLLVVLIFSFFPIGIQPTPAAMNWSSFMVGVIAIVALGYYAVFGRRTYHGPVVETVPEEDY